MANFPLPSEIAQRYLSILKSIKPTLNINDLNSDFVIRGKALSGVLSGLYADQAKVNKDTFTSTARPEALLLKGADLGLTLSPATPAAGTGVRVTGTNGKVINAGDLTLIYLPTNIFYVNTSGGTITNGALSLNVQAQTAGTLGNVAAPDTMTILSPPTGVDVTAQVTAPVSGGSDVETYDSFRSRILSRQKYVPAGGNESDYKAWAFEADASVRSVSIKRFARGLGSVGVVITTGATSVDAAVTNGTPIVRVASDAVVARVQGYLENKAPLTDCPVVYSPTEMQLDVTVSVDLAQGLTLASVPSDAVNNPLGLNIEALIRREVGRVLYKYPIGGKPVPGLTGGYVLASDIEQGLDYWLSASLDPGTGLISGVIPVLVDRQVSPLSGASYVYPVGTSSLVAPGAISVVAGV